MRSSLFAVLILWLLPAAAVSQPFADDPVFAMERQWAQALVATDVETVSELMHPHFRLVRTYGGGAVISREQYLGMTDLDVREARVTPLNVTYYGDTAVAVMNYDFEWSGPSGPLPSAFRVTDVLRFDGGQWRVVSRLSELRDPPQ